MVFGSGTRLSFNFAWSMEYLLGTRRGICVHERAKSACDYGVMHDSFGKTRVTDALERSCLLG